MTIRLLFSRGKTLVSTSIATVTLSWCSHVDFILPDGSLLGAVPSKGVILQPATDREFFARAEEYIVDAPASAIEYAVSQLGKPYDWSGVFSFLFPERDWQDDSKWFCSELVFASLAQAGVLLLNGNPHKITPGNLLLSTLLNPAKGT